MINYIIEQAIKGVLNEHPELISESLEEGYGEFAMPTMDEIDSDTMTPIYRVAFRNQVDSIFKNGYDREFTGTKGGNMYGKGVYTTWSLPDTIHNVQTKPEYGDCIMKMYLIGGFQKFLIFDERKARETYGDNWEIQNQLSLFFPPDLATRMYNDIVRLVRGGGCDIMHGRTAPCAYLLHSNYRRELDKYGIRGFLYKGNRDGKCALPFDFSAVIPYAISVDQGRTWQKKFSNELYQRMQSSIDSEFRYGGKYKVLGKPIEGFQRVIDKKGKYNIIDINSDETAFPNGVDAIAQINPDSGVFEFTEKGRTYLGILGNPEITDNDGNPFYGIVDNNYMPWMTFDFQEV